MTEVKKFVGFLYVDKIGRAVGRAATRRATSGACR